MAKPLFIAAQLTFLGFGLAVYGATVVPGHPLQQYRSVLGIGMALVWWMLVLLWFGGLGRVASFVAPGETSISYGTLPRVTLGPLSVEQDACDFFLIADEGAK